MVIEPRKNKDGKITSYRIVVYDGHNVDGTPKREKMTWRQGIRHIAVTHIMKKGWRRTSPSFLTPTGHSTLYRIFSKMTGSVYFIINRKSQNLPN